MHSSTRIQEGFKFGGVVLPKIKISVFRAKMLSSPETPGIGPETPDLGVRILREGARKLRIFGLESKRW